MKNNLTPFSEKDFNKIIESRVSFDHSQIKQITSCEIDFPISINKHLGLYSGLYAAQLNFTNCIFNKEVDIGNYDNAGSILFKDCFFKDSVIIRSQGNVKFIDNCIFNDNLEIFLDGYRDVLISDISVHKSLTLKGSDIYNLTLKNINIDKPNQELKLILQAQGREFILDNVCFTELLFIRPAKFQKKIVIVNQKFKQLKLDGLELGTSFEIKSSQINELTILKILGTKNELRISDNCLIQNLFLPLDQLTSMEISDSKIDKMNLTKVHSSENILNIQKVISSHIIFENVTNNGLISLRQLELLKDGTFSIKSSNLGKTDFINCKFSNATLEFENSKVTEVFLSETDFPKEVKIAGHVNYPQAQLAFGQLHTAFEKQGDTIRSLEYQSREIEAHYYCLKKWDSNKLNLFLNKLSNDFGRNWVKGIFFTIIVSIFFFYCLVISSEEYRIGFRLDFKFNFIRSFLQFINPLRFFELENLFKKTEFSPAWLTLNWYSYIWDFLGRVFIAYGFYQTIQAFRRFGRK